MKGQHLSYLMICFISSLVKEIILGGKITGIVLLLSGVYSRNDVTDRANLAYQHSRLGALAYGQAEAWGLN